jgi:hypothetical protein
MCDASQTIAAQVLLWWALVLGWLTHARAVLALMNLVINAYEEGLETGWRVAEGVPPASHPLWAASGEMINRYEMKYQEWNAEYQALVAVVKGLHQGGLRFCQATQIEWEELLAVCPPMLEEIKATVATLPAEIPADEKTAKSVEQLLSTLWPRALDNGQK